MNVSAAPRQGELPAGFGDVLQPVMYQSRFSRCFWRSEKLLYFGQGLDERPAAGHCIGGHKFRPVDVGHRQARLILADRLAQGGDRVLGRHGPDAPDSQLLRHGPFGHPSVGPGTPGDGRRRKIASAALLRQRIKVGVRRTVSGASTAAPDPGTGREQHEGVQVCLPENRVQVYGPVDLRPGKFGEVCRCQVGDRDRRLNTRGVQHCRDRVRIGKRRQPVAVGHVTR
jgi:hypothetical protein